MMNFTVKPGENSKDFKFLIPPETFSFGFVLQNVFYRIFYLEYRMFKIENVVNKDSSWNQ